jgi:hypothetical protein
MGFLGRFRGKKESSEPARTPEPPRTRAEAGDRIIEIAQRTVQPAEELTHFFVVSGNPSVIEAYHGLFRVGAPAYGGSAQLYRVERSVLDARREEAAARHLSFAWESAMGRTVEEVASAADALQWLQTEATRGQAHVAYVAVGPSGTGWVREVYTTILDEAVSQMILPFRMLSTKDEAAASFVRASFVRASFGAAG